jgi:hypothetical protein
MATSRLRQLAVALGGPGPVSLGTSCVSYLLHCERSSGRYLFDVLMPVGHDFGIEIGGFRAPGI